ncbi:uncharacterized protein [Solanum lycopersicum]|uniref:uncharacterized protein n=1 Tax=Solanum lycopersicum TaxID=4081 RepID=UPI0002BC909F|nr:uncharacterized protein LOC101244396 [Solanum lycopersicum]
MSRSKDKMKRFVTTVWVDLEEEFRAAMLHENMDLGRLILHEQQVEESHRMKIVKKGKKPGPSDHIFSSTCNSSLGVMDNPKEDKSGPKNMSGYMMRDCQHVKNQAKTDTQPRPNPTATAIPPKRNNIYSLKGREELEKSADVVTGTLYIFSFPVYALLDLGSTLSFVTRLVAYKFVLLPEILHESFIVSTPIGDRIRAERVYRDCPIIVPNIVTYADLIE